jgi:hypothetical protein
MVQINQEAEIGPLKYIAEAIYGQENAANHFDAAVRWIILILVSVFDPLAIVMILAGNVGIVQTRPQIVVKEQAPEAMIMDDIIDIEEEPIKTKEYLGSNFKATLRG